MTGFQGISPEHLARLFFHYREALAPDFPSAPATRCGEGSSWETVHDNERSLLVATAHMVLLELACMAMTEAGIRIRLVLAGLKALKEKNAAARRAFCIRVELEG